MLAGDREAAERPEGTKEETAPASWRVTANPYQLLNTRLERTMPGFIEHPALGGIPDRWLFILPS